MSVHEWNHLSLALTWTSIHFLWQGLVIAALLEAWLAVSKSRSASERYLARCTALGTMVVAPVVTFWTLVGRVAPPSAVTDWASGAGLGEASAEASFLSGTAPTAIVAFWAFGTALLSLRLIGGCLQVLRLRQRYLGVELSPGWQRRFEHMAKEFGVRVRVRMVESASIAVPTVIGVVRPVVLLPARIFTGLSSEQIEALVAHELAHVARYDYLVNLVQTVVEALLFYHPAVWWVSRGIRVEREFCCDDRAVAATHDGLSYARALTALESWRGGQLQLGVSTLGGSLMQRIQRLVGNPAGPNPRLRPLHAFGTLLIFGSMGASAFGFARWTQPTATHDCRCCCHHHKESKPADSSLDSWTTQRIRSIDGTQDIWVVTDGARKRYAALSTDTVDLKRNFVVDLTDVTPEPTEQVYLELEPSVRYHDPVTLSGRVLAQDGTPVEGAVIETTDESSAQVIQTDHLGRFVTGAVDPRSVYRLNVPRPIDPEQATIETNDTFVIQADTLLRYPTKYVEVLDVQSNEATELDFTERSAVLDVPQARSIIVDYAQFPEARYEVRALHAPDGAENLLYDVIVVPRNAREVPAPVKVEQAPTSETPAPGRYRIRTSSEPKTNRWRYIREGSNEDHLQ